MPNWINFHWKWPPKNTIQAQAFQIVQAELNKIDGMIGNESKSSRRMIMRFRNEREKKDE